MTKVTTESGARLVSSERIEFVGGAGATLHGSLRRPDSPARGSVLMAHCFTCSQELHTSTRLAAALVDGGYVVMTFDFTGLGRSAGDFVATSVSTNIADITRAAVALIERDSGPCVLLGHSLGGAAVVLAAHRLHGVTAVVAVGAPASVGHVRHLFADETAARTTSGDHLVSIGGRPFSIGQNFLDDLDEHDVLTAAGELNRPFLVVEAGADEVVGADQTSALATAGGADVAVVDGADHLFTSKEHADALARIVIGWLSSSR